MTPKSKTRISKYLSLILRHKPEEGGLKLDENGWAPTNDVIKALHQKYGEPMFAGLSVGKILREIVAEDDKTRYAFSAHGECIRANQGHSLAVDLGLVEVAPPEYLLHGTAQKTLAMIRRDGLLPMARQYVHLSWDIDTATKVGKRHGEPYVLTIQAHQMFSQGYSFYKSENDVWLTAAVPVEFLLFLDDSNH